MGKIHPERKGARTGGRKMAFETTRYQREICADRFLGNLVRAVQGIYPNLKRPAEKVEAFNNPKINYFEAIDTKGTVKDSLQVKGIPHAILIDPKGIVRWEGFPLLQGNELTEEVIKGLLDKYKN